MLRRITPIVLGLGLLVGVATAPPTAAAVSTEDSTAVAGGVTVIEGDQTGYTRLRFPRPASLGDPLAHPGSFAVSGGADLAGFALVSDEAQPESILVGARLPWKNTEQSGRELVLIPLSGWFFDDRYEIPAGDYRLYLFTEGVPARVELQFEGLDGSASVRPETAVPYVVKTPPWRTAGSSPSQYTVSGDHAELESNGIVFSSLLSTFSSPSASRGEDCFYHRATTDSDFGPGCLPDGAGWPSSVIQLSGTASEPQRLYSYGGVAGLSAGAYGVGYSQAAAGVAEFSSVTLWLSFESESAPLQPQQTATYCAAVPDGAPSFIDTASSTFADIIDCAAFAGLVRGGPQGASPDEYRPQLSTTRGQMASLVARMMDTATASGQNGAIAPLPAYDGTPAFVDVPPDSPHYESIHRLEQAGIVSGGAGGRLPVEYAPDLPVDRAQMASFIARAMKFMTGSFMPDGDNYFNDDDDSVHERSINRVAYAGIAIGNGRAEFRPAQAVSRGQMSAFLVRSLAYLHTDDLVTPATQPS